jgi:hypothetical protein
MGVTQWVILVQVCALVQYSADRNIVERHVTIGVLVSKERGVLPFYSSRARLYSGDSYSTGGSSDGGHWVAWFF